MIQKLLQWWFGVDTARPPHNALPTDLIYWGGMPTPHDLTTHHFCLVGNTGSGKTTTIELLMKQVLPRIKSGADYRAVITDHKGEMLSTLQALQVNCPVFLLDPFDKRSYAWDMAADFESLPQSNSIATLLIRRSGRSQDRSEGEAYFTNTARNILTMAINALCLKAPRRWRLRDLLLVLNSEELLRQLLAVRPEFASALERYQKAKEWPSVRTTIDTFLFDFAPVAAAWHHAHTDGRAISLRDWVNQQNAILLVRSDPDGKEPLQAITQVLLRRLADLVQLQDNSRTRRTWFFLDEARVFHFPGLAEFMVQCRSKGGAVVVAFQSLPGLEEAYGPRNADEILALAAHFAILSLQNDHKTAEWASKLLGRFEHSRWTRSVSHGPGGVTTSRQQQILLTDLYLPTELQALPPCTAAQGLEAVYTAPHLGVYRTRISGDDLQRTIFSLPRGTNDRDARKPEQFYLGTFSAEDFARLGPFPPQDDARPRKKWRRQGEP